MQSHRRRLYALAPIYFLVFIVVVFLFTFPAASVDAASHGVAIWWDILFPALLPFFIVSELMIGLGVVHFLSSLLDPFMRPLFRVSGSGGFVLAIGFASGYPVGARLTAQLWDAGLLGRKESERLIAFTTTADPIFLIGAVSVGLLNDVSLAPILAIAHYGGAVALGIVLGFVMRTDSTQTKNGTTTRRTTKGWLANALLAMHHGRLLDGRPLGSLLWDGITNGLRLSVIIGGLVVFFAVIIQVLSLSNVLSVMQYIADFVLNPLHIPAPLTAALINGLFEVTLGAQSTAASGEEINSQLRLTILSFILAWGGLSVHAQIMSLVGHLSIRYASFAGAKLLHGIFSAIIAFYVWDLFAR
jgi:sporulation integral membrane protein YlbJ